MLYARETYNCTLSHIDPLDSNKETLMLANQMALNSIIDFLHSNYQANSYCVSSSALHPSLAPNE